MLKPFYLTFASALAFSITGIAFAATTEAEFVTRCQIECLTLPHHAFESRDFASGKPNSMRCQTEGDGDGPSASWFSTGGMKSRGALKDDLAEGTWMYWYASGEMRAEGICKEGHPTSEWKTYAQKQKSPAMLPPEEEKVNYCETTHEYATDGSSTPSSFAKMSWLNFRFEPVFVQQSDGGASYSVGIHYTPEFRISNGLSLSPDLGIFPLADAGVGDKFLVSQAALLIEARLYGSIRGEAGIGEQYWGGRVNSASTLIFDLGWDMPLKSLKQLKMLYTGLTTFNNSSNLALEYRLGMEWTL